MGRFLKVAGLAALVIALVLAALYGVWTFSRSRDVQLFGKLVSHVETQAPVIAITFDDGPTPGYTEWVLDVLAAKGVAATFFLTGAEIDANPELASAIVAAGHEVGNHTWSHPNMTLAGPGKAASEVDRTNDAIRRAGYEGEILFRPPYGKKLVFLPLHLQKTGQTTVMWDIEPESYGDIAASPERIVDHVLEKAKPGSILILHVMYTSREPTRQALPAIIDGLRERGFRFETVSGLMSLEGR